MPLRPKLLADLLSGCERPLAFSPTPAGRLAVEPAISAR
jgi:hypothetical protein